MCLSPHDRSMLVFYTPALKKQSAIQLMYNNSKVIIYPNQCYKSLCERNSLQRTSTAGQWRRWRDSLFCGKATAVATCPRHVAKSRLSNPSIAKKNYPQRAVPFLAEMEGFEPPGGVTRQLISSQPRYDHFDTSPYALFSPYNLPFSGPAVNR